MSTIELNNRAESKTFECDGWEDRAYRCHVCVFRDDDGFSAVVLNLPGVGSCGDTEDEAMQNIREAVIGAIECYNDANETIPWRDSSQEDIPSGSVQKWIIVNA